MAEGALTSRKYVVGWLLSLLLLLLLPHISPDRGRMCVLSVQLRPPSSLQLAQLHPHAYGLNA